MKLDDEQIRRILLGEFNIETRTVTYLHGGIDDVWRCVDDADKAWYVRVIDIGRDLGSNSTTRADFLAALSGRGLDVPSMRRRTDRQAHSAPIGTYRVEASSWVPGEEVQAWTEPLAEMAGAALAEFSAYSRASRPPLGGWRSYAPAPILLRGWAALGGDPRWSLTLELLRPVMTDLQRRLEGDVQVILGDISRGNFLNTGLDGGLRLTGFASLGAGSGWYDFASAFSSFARLGNAPLNAAFVRGYVQNDRMQLPDRQTMSRLMTLRDVAIATFLVTARVRAEWVEDRLAQLARNCEVAAVADEHVALADFARACPNPIISRRSRRRAAH